MMENSVLNYFYTGRIYQFYLDNKDFLAKGQTRELGFLVPKKEGIEIAKIKKMVNSLIKNDGIVIKSSALPKRGGWRISFGIVS